jgi:hypothetical protein
MKPAIGRANVAVSARKFIAVSKTRVGVTKVLVEQNFRERTLEWCYPQLSKGRAVMTKTIRSQFVHEIGEMVEGFVILEKRTVIPPTSPTRRHGVYDYLVEVPPIPMKEVSGRTTVPERGSFTRSTPEQRSGVVRRVPSR